MSQLKVRLIMKPLFFVAVSSTLVRSRYFSVLAEAPPTKLRGIVFDMDGTLTRPNLDFKKMYSRCGVPLSEDLLVAVASMPPEKKARANAIIEEGEFLLMWSFNSKIIDNASVKCP